MNKLTGIFVAGLLAALAACSPSGGPADSGADAPLQDMGSPTDNFGIYSGTVGGRPGFLAIVENPGELVMLSIALSQTGDDTDGFSGSGKPARETPFDFENDWPNGGGQFYKLGRYSGPRRGAARIRGVWEINKSFVGRVTHAGSRDSVLDFDLAFDPVTLSTYPEGNVAPAGRYDVLHGGRDIGDYVIETPGEGTGSITWPGAARPCKLITSHARRAMGTTRNVWWVGFNSEDFSCAPPSWSIGYAKRDDGHLTFNLIVVRQGNFAPAPEGETDMVQLQLRRR